MGRSSVSILTSVYDGRSAHTSAVAHASHSVSVVKGNAQYLTRRTVQELPGHILLAIEEGGSRILRDVLMIQGD